MNTPETSPVTPNQVQAEVALPTVPSDQIALGNPKESIGSKDSGHSSTRQENMTSMHSSSQNGRFEDGWWHCGICPDRKFQNEHGLKTHLRAKKCSPLGSQKRSVNKKALKK